ncbi:MAG: class I SAM-dependent methyltransferase [Methanomassiliicoccaceae archaeon]|jgi:SAM-dependent methyltransferase|nr:class I SAM-dependent methyltransferase [Methanomassiliicoccaceae archaeon]
MTHPFDGEGLTYGDRLRFWDDLADSYSSVQQGRIVDDIVCHLSAEGILSPGSSVLELGSGPGTYSLKVAPLVGDLTCVDSSARMMGRMITDAGRSGIGNIMGIVSDFFELCTDRRFDLVMATLCPGTGTPEGILRMGSLSRGYCVHIMWIRNCWDDIHARIWRALGKEYSFDGRRTDAVSEYLKDTGNDPEVLEFRDRVELSMPFGDAVRRESASFAAYGLGAAEVSEAVENVLSEMRCGETLRYDGDNAMRVIIWRPGGGTC